MNSTVEPYRRTCYSIAYNFRNKPHMKKTIILLLLALLCSRQAIGQQYQVGKRATPSLAVKSNLLHDATTSMNLGMEFKVVRKLTMDVPVTYNPWTFNDNKKFKNLLIQPELRWWSCEPFNGHFFGFHGHYAYYNVGGYGSDHMKESRHEGWLAGAGLSYGYQFYIAPRWNLSFNIGLGYAYMDYEEWECRKCGDFQKKDTKHYFGPTRAGVSLVFFIK